jgi:hypothetical protein
METDTETTNQLLRVVIALLLEQTDSIGTLKEKVAFLERLGLGPTEISRVLGRTTSHVSKELAGIRKEKKGDL